MFYRAKYWLLQKPSCFHRQVCFAVYVYTQNGDVAKFALDWTQSFVTFYTQAGRETKHLTVTFRLLPGDRAHTPIIRSIQVLISIGKHATDSRMRSQFLWRQKQRGNNAHKYKNTASAFCKNDGVAKKLGRSIITILIRNKD